MSEPGSGLFGWLRRPPTKPAGPEVKALFERVADDPWFHKVAGLSPAEVVVLKSRLASASICYSTILQGGYAGRPETRGLVLGLSRLHRHKAAAAHELFHLARDVRGQKDLDDETWVLIEELIVWSLTFEYAPVSTAFVLVLSFGILGVLAAPIVVLLEIYCRLLGFEGLVDAFRRVFQ
jgi:hypothetical protein